MKILGIFHFPGYADPSAAVVIDGSVVAFVEEERLVRNKHASAYFPSRAVAYTLKQAGLTLDDIDCISFGWDCYLHQNGGLSRHFEDINRKYPPTSFDLAYQERRLTGYTPDKVCSLIKRELRHLYSKAKLPEIIFVRHHLAHAVSAYFHSNLGDALVLAIDGSGEIETTTWWEARNRKLKLLRAVKTPHSLGWFYSAFTEYLVFEAYDGEYKVMGLAAYGKHDPELARKLKQLIWYDGYGGIESNPHLLAMGPRTYSPYVPDRLVDFLGRPPRSKDEEIDSWFINLAFEVQQRLEEIVFDMTKYWVKKTGLRNLAIGGGVGLNVKMNGNLFASGDIDDIFIHPLCSDTGMAIASAMTVEYQNGTLKPQPLEHLYFGPSYSDKEIEASLQSCMLSYTREERIELSVAKLLNAGLVVGWFQGGMEAGPRALGNRSILADPRRVASRDRVNGVVKFREFWRPFCPSMTESGARKYMAKYTRAPFMIITFNATTDAKQEIEAVVHVDGTSRTQIVSESVNPLYYRLLKEFEAVSGVPVVLNTSFNVKGEPIVCTPHDAIRTYAATGLEALAIGPYLLVKPGVEHKHQ